MDWRSACAASPSGRAVRLRRPGQRMYVTADGDCYEQAKPNYSQYKDVRTPASKWLDWIPCGMTADRLEQLRVAPGADVVVECPPADPQTVTAEYGFLSPAGDFFGCGYGHHMYIAEGLLFRLTGAPPEALRDAEDQLREVHGWAVLKGNDFWLVPENWTAAQRDFIWDWCQLAPGRHFSGRFDVEPRKLSLTRKLR